MILYTAIPIEQIFNQKENPDTNLVEIEYHGRTVIVELNNQYEATIVQLISSNPNDYLRTEFMPGKLIKFKPN